MSDKLLELSNFYLIELKNEALSCIFKNSYNLSFFVVASDDFKNDIEAINASDKIVETITNQIGNHTVAKSEFNPNLFPHIGEDWQMAKNENDEVIDNVHPLTAKRTTVTLFNQPIILARTIASPQNEPISIQ